MATKKEFIVHGAKPQGKWHRLGYVTSQKTQTVEGESERPFTRWERLGAFISLFGENILFRLRGDSSTADR